MCLVLYLECVLSIYNEKDIVEDWYIIGSCVMFEALFSSEAG